MLENEVLDQEQDDLFADESDDEEDLFADYESDETDKPTEVTDDDQSNVDDHKDEEGNSNTDPQVAGTQDQPFLTINYMKEAKNLTKEEAEVLAQKGMDYDRIKTPYSEISRLAKANGMSVDDYIKNLSDVQESFDLNKEVEALKKQYPNSDEELLKEVAKTHLKENANILSKQEEIEAQARKDEIGKQLDKFQSRYPDIDPKTLDKSVYQKMSEGYTLLEAYDSFLDDQRKVEAKNAESLNKIKEQNQANKNRSLGNISNNGYGGEDIFIKELFADD